MSRLDILVRQLQWMVPKRGTGSPEGVVVGKLGDRYVNEAGGVGQTFWVKEEDDGLNTGWAAK